MERISLSDTFESTSRIIKVLVSSKDTDVDDNVVVLDSIMSDLLLIRSFLTSTVCSIPYPGLNPIAEMVLVVVLDDDDAAADDASSLLLLLLSLVFC